MKTRFMVIMAAACLSMAGSAHAWLKDNGNGTISDPLRLGMVWLKNANCFGGQTWSDAVNSAQGLHSGMCGLSDNSKAGQWRLPTKEELQTRIGNWEGFTNVRQYSYWTSTTKGDTAWTINIMFHASRYTNKNDGNYVWLVRPGS